MTAETISPSVPSSVPSSSSTRNRKTRTKRKVKRTRSLFAWWKVGSFVLLVFIFWNVLSIVQQHNRVVNRMVLSTTSQSGTNHDYYDSTEVLSSTLAPTATTKTPLSSSSSQEPENDNDNDTTSSRRKMMQEVSFVYANTTYKFRYHVNATIGTTTKTSAEDLSILDLPNIVFGVLSTSTRRMRRDVIRSTWGKNDEMYFLVAEEFVDSDNNNKSSISSSSSSQQLESEFYQYGDLVWLDAPENYRNALTPKTFMFLQFTRKVLLSQRQRQQPQPQRHRRKIDYIFKTDDDVWVNSTEIGVELVKEGWPEYYGMNMSGVPLRDTSAKIGAKWVLSKEEYPRDDYPPYASGLGYALSATSTTASSNALLDVNNTCLDQTMSSMRHMPWEDVATGLLSEACHVSLTSSYKYWTDTGNGTHNPYLPWEPYETYKDGGVVVKVLHKPRPHWYGPLLVQGSLREANARYEQQRTKMKQAQRKNRQQQKQNRRHEKSTE